MHGCQILSLQQQDLGLPEDFDEVSNDLLCTVWMQS